MVGSYDVAQKTLFGKDKEYSLPGYEVFPCYRHTRKKVHHGIATIVRKDMPAKVNNIHTLSGTDTQSVDFGGMNGIGKKYQETLLGKDKEYSLPGYEAFRCDCHTKKKACCGTATFIRKDVRAKVTNMHNLSGSDTQLVEIWWMGKKYQIYNWYQPPSDKRVSLDLGKSDVIFRRTIIRARAKQHPMRAKWTLS
ncbi:hypothetical protein PoB_007505800 [Plakobranchus ocellatus]|uniref:Uncharacterized protein n=1 Tax=Plakobranchus ocellatus TaxID=259542 RepID=A0AAV4DVY4_9GAST|nr:hypothetical protein PoB_007505800 [Plakobranchus ocellatus]